MDLNIVRTVLYFAALIVYQIVGVWSIVIDFRGKQNRLLCAMAIGLAFWVFSMAIMSYTSSYSEAVVLARVAGLGVSATGALFLHFALINTESLVFKNSRWIFYIIPLFLYVIIYVLSDDLVVRTATGYNLRWVEFGFSQNWAEHLSNLYAFMCFSGAIYIMYSYQKRSIHPKLKNQTRVLLIGSLAAFAMLFVTCLVRAIFWDALPPSIVTSSIIMVITILYDSLRYKFLSRRIALKHSVDESALASEDHSVHITNMFLIYCNVMYILLFFFGKGLSDWNQMVPTVISVIVMYFMALSNLNPRRKDIYLAIVVAINFFIGFSLSADLGIKTVSTFGFTVLVFVVISKSWTVRFMLMSAMVLGNVLMGRNMFGFEFLFGMGDYFFRLAFAVMILYALLYVGKKISDDDSKNYDHLKFQEILTALSIKSVEGRIDNMSELIDEVVSAVSDYFEAEQSYILVREGDRFVDFEYSLSDDKVFSIPDDFVENLAEDEFIYASCASRLSLEDEDRVYKLFGAQTNSLLVIPIFRDGAVYAVYCGVSRGWMKDALSDIVRTISNTIKNIFEKRDKENTIYSYAYFDTSSGLPNRNMFARSLGSAIETAGSGNVAVVFIGFEYSKRIGGVNGRDIPEQHLGVIGNRLYRPNVLVARFGNDNLILLLTNYEDLEAELETIHSAFKEPIKAGGASIDVSIVTGVSVYPKDGDNARTLVKNADLALYEARRHASLKSVRYSEELAKKLEERLMLTNSLHRAQENNELMLMYQPQVDAKSGAIVGAEALIRWQHPEKGMISPGIFIPLAEESGVISSIGRWVLEEACAQNKKWQRMYGKKLLMAVNVSTRQLQDGALAKTVENVLKKTGLEPDCLEIEVTESEQMTRGANQAIYNLHRLRELGVKIAIDDFGTKHSSLSRLRHMPITKLKIDMGFVRALENGEKHQNLVRSIIGLGKNLGLTVLAEGVETKFQYDFLRDNGCDKIQGYYFFKPLRQEEVERLLLIGVGE